MWIKYSYDLGSLGPSEQYAFKLPEKYLFQGSIPYLEVLELLKENNACLFNPVLLLLDLSLSCYSKVNPEEKVPITSPITLKIRNGEANQFACVFKKLSELENSLRPIENYTMFLEAQNSPVKSREQVDIAMLYAAPLVRRYKGKDSPCDDWNLDFEKERDKLLKAFEIGHINPRMRFSTATLENLREALECNPSIVHISCHGYYQDKEGFVLAFESSKMTGRCDEITKERLYKAISQCNKGFKIAIVSACFSEAIGDVFLDAGIECVISIHDQCKILDDAAVTFACSFYKKIFDGKSILKAFEEASSLVESEQSNMQPACCCAHIHKTTCAWKTSKHDHTKHTPDCKCNNKSFIHKLDCSWAKEFLSTYDPKRVPSEDEIQEGKWVICCCSPESPHNEGLKFKLLCKDQKVKHMSVFTGTEQRPKILNNKWDFEFKPPLVRTKMLARNSEMIDLLENTRKNRLVVVDGELGVGKTLLVKTTARYACERKLFKHGVIYLDCKDVKNAGKINQMLAEELKNPWSKSREELCRMMDRLQVLVVLDNLDLIAKRHEEHFNQKITYMLERTSFPKFWVVCQNPLNLDQSSRYKLNLFTERNAILKFIGGVLPRSVMRTEKDKIKQIVRRTGTNTSDLLKLIPLLKERPASEVLAETESGTTSTAKENVSLHLSMLYLRNRLPESIDFLSLISFMPKGVYKGDLKYLCHGKPYKWKKILELVMDKQNELQNQEVSEIWLSESNNQVLKVSNSIKEFMLQENNYNPQNAFDCLMFLSKLASALLFELIKTEGVAVSEVMKSLSNSSALAPTTTWQTKIHHIDDIKELRQSILCNKQHFSIHKRLLMMEENFWHFLDKDTMTKLYLNLEDESKSVVGNCVFDIGQCLTCFYLVFKKTHKAFEALDQTRNCLKTLHFNELYLKCRLTRAGILLYHKKDLYKAKEEADKACNDFSIKKMKDYQAEGLLLKALILKEIFLSSQRSLEVSVEFIEKCFLDSVERFKEHNQYEARLGKARALMGLCEWRLFTKKLGSSFKEDINEALKIFREKNLRGLEIRALQMLGEYNLDMSNLIEAEKLWNVARNRAKKYKDRKAEQETNDKLEFLFDKIRQKNQNLILVLRAFSLVEIENGEVYEPENICNFFSNFRENLSRVLMKEQKLINIHFDIATESKIKSYLTEGCRVLHITSYSNKRECLVLEKEDSSSLVLNPEEIVQLLGDGLRKHGVDLIVFATPQSFELGQYVFEESLVPNVVCFDYKDYLTSPYLTQVQILIEKTLGKFCDEFYKHLIKGKSLGEAWSIAKDVSDYFALENKVVFEHIPHRKGNYQGKGPVLLGDAKSALFSDEEVGILSSQARLQSGSLFDTSKPKPPTNIKKRENAFVGRKCLMYKAVSALKHKKILHVNGVKGIGKSSLLKRVGYFLNAHNYFKEGIFHIGLRKKSTISEFMKELMNEGLVEEEVDIRKSFEEKDMLIILDDCEDLIRASGESFANLLQILNQECGIAFCVLSCPVEFKLECSKLDLKPLDSLESAALLMATLERNLTREELVCNNSDLDIARVLTDCEPLKRCMNLPGKIVELAKRLKNKNMEELQYSLNLEKSSSSFSDGFAISVEIPDPPSKEPKKKKPNKSKKKLKKKNSSKPKKTHSSNY